MVVRKKSSVWAEDDGGTRHYGGGGGGGRNIFFGDRCILILVLFLFCVSIFVRATEFIIYHETCVCISLTRGRHARIECL